MESKEMHQDITDELFAGFVGFVTYIMQHFLDIKFLQVSVVPQSFDIGNKLLNMLIAVVTACVAYLAVYLVKRFVTHEIKGKK